MAYFSMNELEQAATVLVKALDRDPGAVDLAPLLAASYAHLGRRKDARTALLRYQPEASESELQEISSSYHYPYKWAYSQGAMKDLLIDGLYIAALPLDVSVSDFADGLKSKDQAERFIAAQSIRRFGPQAVEVVPALIDALADESGWVRSEAAIVLGKIGPGAIAAVPALIALRDAPRKKESDSSQTEFHVKNALKKIYGE